MPSIYVHLGSKKAITFPGSTFTYLVSDISSIFFKDFQQNALDSRDRSTLVNFSIRFITSIFSFFLASVREILLCEVIHRKFMLQPGLSLWSDLS